MPAHTKAYLVGGGIGSLAAAAFLIRDGKFAGSNISIFDEHAVMGGSLDGAGTPGAGYSLRGGRMFTTDNYECTWDLFKSIPSLQHPGKTVFEETSEFNRDHPSHSLARLIDHARETVPATSMGFSMQDRIDLVELAFASEERLSNSPITHWLKPHFFETTFWYLWATTFAFQPWHSAVEFKRYLHRFILEFARIDTLAGVKRTVFNQYDSLVRPLQSWLEAKGVKMMTSCKVTQLDHETIDGMFCVIGLHCNQNGQHETMVIDEDDLVFLQNGSMTDASSLGSMTNAPKALTKTDSHGWALWEELAQARSDFGNPAAFNTRIAQSCWESFTVTVKQPAFFDAMERLTGNEAGSGGLVTFKDSNWLMSMVLAHQPHFIDQPSDVQVFWGYGLFPDRVGNFVAKPMAACTGAEILQELCGHLRFDLEVLASANCIPCRMPYITSMFLTRAPGDRPLPVPAGSKNFAFISQFVEIADDVVFTVEYSVRAAQMAVYALLKIDHEVPPVTPYDHSLRTDFDAVIKSFA